MLSFIMRWFVVMEILALVKWFCQGVFVVIVGVCNVIVIGVLL